VFRGGDGAAQLAAAPNDEHTTLSSGPSAGDYHF